jgi:hypothetical protein
MRNIILLIAGHSCLFLGIIGAFLPIIPTTPFLLLAAFCYSKSNHKLHTWIIGHKYLGPPINDWEKNGVISLKAKFFASIMLSLVMIFRIPSLEIELPFKIFAIVTILLVLIFIWSRPSCNPS